jgi:uncharacterized membrane protein
MPGIPAAEVVTNRWENLRTSLWFVPSICFAVAFALSFLLPELDKRVLGDQPEPPAYLFEGSGEGAQRVLSTIAGALITVITVVFSITIMVLQQASAQFTPRVMGNFIRRTSNQLVLGIFLGTSLYALLVLRYVRSEDAPGGEFIPVISMTVALVFTTVCFALLVFFIHSTATSLQASAVTASAHDLLRDDIQRLFPEEVGDPRPKIGPSLEEFRRKFPDGPTYRVHARDSGFLRAIDDHMIISGTGQETRWAAVLPQIGYFITKGAPILELGPARDLSEKQIDRIQRAFLLDQERSSFNDPLFGVRQLVDIALKALSTGVNDPTTAEYALSALGDVLAGLADRDFPHPVREVVTEEGDEKRRLFLWANRPEFGEYVAASFDQIRQNAAGDFHVTKHMLTVLTDIARCVKSPERSHPIEQQIDAIARTLDDERLDPWDHEQLRIHVSAARQELLAALSRA